MTEQYIRMRKGMKVTPTKRPNAANCRKKNFIAEKNKRACTIKSRKPLFYLVPEP